MIVTYIRSSSYHTHSFCEQQYFLSYVLGLESPPVKKTVKGTILHKIMEILAESKLAQQNSKTEINDDIVGQIDVNNLDLDDICNKVYSHYSSSFSSLDWKPLDLKHCRQWTEKTLKMNNGVFDPRTRDIVAAEQHFDIVIDKEWANYEYDVDGEKLVGKLGIKGTIDLITKIDGDTLEIIDYKSGQRKDWITGQEKTLAKFYEDPQLKIYYYAIAKMFPEIEHVIMTIVYVNDGGAFSVLFDKSSLTDIENMIRIKFDQIRKCKKPQLSRSWKCSKFCHFGRNTFQNHDSILPIIEYRDNRTCANGEIMTICEQVRHDTELKGLKQVIKEYSRKDHSVSNYKNPGESK